MTSCCYLLYTNNNTYIGATVNMERRLRQHNKEISGGARATGIQVGKGNKWELICYITGIPEWRSALQIEWKWKNISRTICKNIHNPIERRIHALKILLSLEKPTKNSMSYESYPDGLPTIIWFSDTYKNLYDSL